MTLKQAIHTADRAWPNSCALEEKCRWLTLLDWRVMGEILQNCEGELPAYDGYDPQGLSDPILLIPNSHRDVYHYWLEAQLHYANGELERYNNAIRNFNTAYREFRNHWFRTHRPKGRTRRYF